MRKVVLFDLGNTLVRYYERSEFPTILEKGIGKVAERLRADGRLRADTETIHKRVAEENQEAADNRVRPLEGRLARIFEVDETFAASLCAEFMIPIFQVGKVYEETIPVLKALRSRGIRTGLVSNTAWGSPAQLWRNELHRLELDSGLDHVIFCRDVGWRKPDRRIFEWTLQRVGAPASDCLYVGDNPRWDRAGPASVGMDSVLVERGDYFADGGPSVHGLEDLLRMI